MITPAFTGQYYQDTSTKKLWKANSTTPGDWTAVGNVNKSGAGDPTGVATPDFTGQTYRDTATNNIWTSTGLTNADWSLTVQDFKIQWIPRSLKFPEKIYYTNGDYHVSCSTLTFNQEHLLDGVEYNGNDTTDLVIVNFPNLIDVDPSKTYYAGIYFYSHLGLTTFNAPLLVEIGLDLMVNYDNLTTINCPELVTIGDDLSLNDNPNFSSFSLPKYLPTNTSTLNLRNCALNLASIDGFLARVVASATYVSGAISLQGGTNASPTQGAGSAHDILVARGVTITHN